MIYIDALWFVFWLLIVPCALMVLFAEYVEPWIKDRPRRIRHRRRMASRRRFERELRKEVKWLWS